MTYRTIEELLDLIDEPNGSICKKILFDNRKLFQTVQGSTNNHQNWPGGYFDHVQEIMNIAVLTGTPNLRHSSLRYTDYRKEYQPYAQRKALGQS